MDCTRPVYLIINTNFSLNETLNQTEIDMNNSKYKLTEELTNLLNETAEAHHKAFAATDGEDPEWPIWYADYLLDSMRIMLNSKFTKSELIYILVSADKEKELVAPGLIGLDSMRISLSADTHNYC